MVSMERELNKLFNDTNYNKENVIIREIWSIKLELQNFFWGVYMKLKQFIMHFKAIVLVDFNEISYLSFKQYVAFSIQTSEHNLRPL